MAHGRFMMYTLVMDVFSLLDKLKGLDDWPAPFEDGEQMWDDIYISRNMLLAHLDESNDKASYHKSLRQRVAGNIIKRCGLKSGDSLLDLGCGPGLYAQEFAKQGIRYTGVDISRQSLGYAMSHKGEYSKLISYIQADYTQYDFEREFDCATMIWCDFGALAPDKRDSMLEKVSGAVKPGGNFCFDVYAVGTPFGSETKSWRIEDSGFWQEGEYLLLERSKYYSSVGAGLYMATVVSGDKVRVFRIWDKRYSKPELVKVLIKSGFHAVEIKKGGLSKIQRDMYGVFLKCF